MVMRFLRTRTNVGTSVLKTTAQRCSDHQDKPATRCPSIKYFACVKLRSKDVLVWVRLETDFGWNIAIFE